MPIELIRRLVLLFYFSPQKTQLKASMNQLAFVLDLFFKFIAYLLGRDILILADAPDKSLFDFKRWSHGQQGCEYFGLGLHLIVSPRQMPQKNQQ